MADLELDVSNMTLEVSVLLRRKAAQRLLEFLQRAAPTLKEED